MAVCRTCYQLPSIQQKLLSSETPIRAGTGIIISGRQLFDFDSEEIPCN